MGRFSSSRARFRGMQQRGYRPSLAHLVALLAFAYLLVVMPYFFTVLERRELRPTPSPYDVTELPQVPTYEPDEKAGPWYNLEEHDTSYDIVHRELPGVRSGSALTSHLRGEDQGTSRQVVSMVPIDWFSECGCTGIEIESVNLCARLLPSFPGLRMNHCPNRCAGPFKHLESSLQVLSAPRAQSARIVVVHIAYQGVCGLPHELSQYMKKAKKVPVGSDRPFLVSRTMTEEDRIAEESQHRCDESFDEVWVPSHFTRKAFLKSGVRPTTLFRVPETIDFQEYSRTAVKEPLKLFPKQPEVTFVFLSVFKWEERKNWQMLLSAFCDTFRNNSHVGLYIKTFAYPGVHPALDASFHLMQKEHPDSAELLENYPDEQDWRRRQLLGVEDLRMEELRTDVSQCGTHIALDESKLPMDHMPALYAAADAFVLPTHGEGWGLPFMEAMAMELPTIGTAWGGNMDFMTHNNSWLVPVELVEGSSLDGRWAEPNRTALDRLLLDVYTNRGSLKQQQRTANAREGLLRAFDGAAGVHAARSRLERIVNRLPYAPG